MVAVHCADSFDSLIPIYGFGLRRGFTLTGTVPASLSMGLLQVRQDLWMYHVLPGHYLTLRIALTGNDERVTAPTALHIGLVTEVVDREQLWDRAHVIAAGIAAKPSAATQGTVRAIWESLDRPYRAAMEQGLIYTRLGNPIGLAEVAGRERPPGKPQPRLR